MPRRNLGEWTADNNAQNGSQGDSQKENRQPAWARGAWEKVHEEDECHNLKDPLADSDECTRKLNLVVCAGKPCRDGRHAPECEACRKETRALHPVDEIPDDKACDSECQQQNRREPSRLGLGEIEVALTRSIPIEKCLDDAMLVYSQNGERLRPQQGYPLRLLLPGFEGNMNVKWLRRLKVVAEPAYSREETSKYTDLMPDGLAREFTFYMEAKSIVTRPSGGQKLGSPGFHEITGLAWTGHGKIRRVDVSVDGGKNWQEAQLQEPVLTRALTRFRLPWQWDGQPAVVQSRATDETGYVQPTFAELLAVRGENSFYHNNAIQPWRIDAQGQVTNANS